MGYETIIHEKGQGIAHPGPLVIEFGEIAATKGLKAALDWRDSRFGDYRTSEAAKKVRESRSKT